MGHTDTVSVSVYTTIYGSNIFVWYLKKHICIYKPNDLEILICSSRHSRQFVSKNQKHFPEKYFLHCLVNISILSISLQKNHSKLAKLRN